MPNSIGPTGLTTATQAELVAAFTVAAQKIYGSDINIASSTPDGQWIMIFIQAVLDELDLTTTVNSMFDPDQAVGVVLDQRVAINGIQRQAGTFTVTPVTVVNSQSVNLYGLDQTAQPIYTVSDNAGNQWQLQATVLGLAPGSNVLSFQSSVAGAVLTVPNTITVPVTIVLGVTSVNNPTTYSVLGINEESDAQLRLRRRISVQLASQGYLSGLIAALKNVSGVSSVSVYENLSGAPNGDSPDTQYPDGTPGHSIWVIISGSPSNTDIANAIYTKRNAGCGMRGETSSVVTQVDGSPFTVLWDVVSTVPLFIKFTATALAAGTVPNITAIRSGLPGIFNPGVYAEVNINELATLVQQIDPNTLVTNAGFSTSATGPFTNTLTPSSKKLQFVTSSPDIIILSMVMSPALAVVAPLGTQQFTALGGYGAYTWTMDSNPSGGSVNSSGLYTAGSTGSVTDVVRATDTQGNYVTANITVTT